MKVAGVILAGGQATRMGGGDKCLRPLGGQPILQIVVDRLGPQVTEIVLNANGDPARFANFGLPVVADETGEFLGPLAGLLAAMDWARGAGVSHLLSVAGDTPFFPTDLGSQLARACGDGAALQAIAQSRDEDGTTHRQPTFGLWDVALADDLRAFLAAGDRKIILWARRHTLATPVVGPSSAFFNINTPADLDAAQAMVGEAR